MNVQKSVPFFANTPDDTHCFQAALRMILKYYEPRINFTWEELDTISAKQPDMWTWPMAGLCWLADRGYEIVNVEHFDYQRLINERQGYLIERYGAEIADEAIKHSSLPAELIWARRFTEKVDTQDRLPDAEDIKDLLARDYLLIANVNARSMNGRRGYAGHFVVLTGFNDKGPVMHDPGLPPMPHRAVSWADFRLGWEYPDAQNRNIVAIRK